MNSDNKKDRRRSNTGGQGTKMNERNTHMNDTTKKPIAQGVVKYGRFKAHVSYFADGNMDYRIEMEPMDASEYEENGFTLNEWERTLKRDIELLHWEIHDFAHACWKAGRAKNAV